MLTMLRDATKGWTAKILLFLLVASFAVWGVSGTMLQGVGNSVITVGETRVTPIEYRLAYDTQLNQLSRQFGTRITREQAEAFGISANVLTQLVSGALLDERARQMGLGMSQDRLASLIGEDPAFRDATGQFSRSRLQTVLRSVGMSEDQYVETRQAVAVRNQIIEATAGELELPQEYWNLLARHQAQERVFEFVKLTEADIEEIPEPTDAEVTEYYEANPDEYQAPEYRKLNIVKLEASDIADEGAVTDEAIRADYEARKDSFSTPEKRTIQQLVFTDGAEAEKAAEALKAGTSFDAILEEQGKTPEDVALGTLSRSDIPDPAVAEAAFGLAEGQTSDLVEGLFGKVILRVTAIEQGETKPLSEVEGEIREALALTDAAADIYDTHDRLEDERAAGEPLVNAAGNVGLTARTIEAVDRTARDADGNIINDIPRSQELLAAAFDIDEGVETDPINIGTDGFVWYEVVEIIPERQKTLDEVRDQVKADWKEAQKRKAIAELAEKMRARIADGETFNAVIADLLPSQEDAPARVAQSTPAITRTGQAIGLPQPAVTAGFGIAEGGAMIQPDENGINHYVVRVASVMAGSQQSVAENRREQLNTSLSDDVVNQMITRIQQQETVEIHQDAIAAALAY